MIILLLLLSSCDRVAEYQKKEKLFESVAELLKSLGKTMRLGELAGRQMGRVVHRQERWLEKRKFKKLIEILSEASTVDELEHKLSRMLGNENNENILSQLLNAEISCEGIDHTHMLHLAVQNGISCETVESMLERGAVITLRDGVGNNVLMSALIRGPEANYVLYALLNFAAEKGCINLIVKQRNNSGMTPLHFAAASGEDNNLAVGLLIGKGADPRAKNVEDNNFNALHYAVANRKYYSVYEILSNIPDTDRQEYVNEVADGGKTALMIAAQNGDNKVVKILLDKGAQVDAISQRYGRTALMYAVKYGNNRVVKRLIKYGANVGAVDINGRTALMYAVKYDRIKIVKMLLPLSNVDAQDHFGKTVLVYARERGCREIIDLLE